jgi:hypothetical protein
MQRKNAFDYFMSFSVQFEDKISRSKTVSKQAVKVKQE